MENLNIESSEASKEVLNQAPELQKISETTETQNEKLEEIPENSPTQEEILNELVEEGFLDCIIGTVTESLIKKGLIPLDSTEIVDWQYEVRKILRNNLEEYLAKYNV